MQRIDYCYPSGLKALSDISLEVTGGEMLAVMGRNASGKTTLVKHINGLLKPSRGKILVFGQDVSGVSVAQSAARVGMVFQNPEEGFFADTVEEEIAFGLKNNGASAGEVKRRVERMLEDFGLTGYRHKFPRSLGSGEKQRLALASVIATGPGILVLDEPTRGIEERLKIELMEFLSNYRKEGNTVILVTHDIELIARFGERIVLMSEGRIVVDGDKHEVMSRALMYSPQINRRVQSFESKGVPWNLLTVDEIMESMS